MQDYVRHMGFWTYMVRSKVCLSNICLNWHSYSGYVVGEDGKWWKKKGIHKMAQTWSDSITWSLGLSNILFLVYFRLKNPDAQSHEKAGTKKIYNTEFKFNTSLVRK